jgi:hypothetical protein
MLAKEDNMRDILANLLDSGESLVVDGVQRVKLQNA